MIHPQLFEQRTLTRTVSQGLVSEDHWVLLAVSGGPDSVALLLMFLAWQQKLPLTLGVCHINYGLRGEESDRDAEFVERFCSRWQVPLFQHRLDLQATPGWAKGRSLQQVAREIRYEILTQEGKKWGADKIALGHTQDDQAETVLMRMLRGSGTLGLSGMASIRSDQIIRPFLHISRQEILEYLQGKGEGYCEDSSNQKDIYCRNRIRREVIPVLQQFNPQVKATLSRQADILRAETQYLDEKATQAFESIVHSRSSHQFSLSREKFLKLPLALQRRVMVKVFQRLTDRIMPPRFDTIEEVIGLVHGRHSGWSTHRENLWISRDYDVINFSQDCVNAMWQSSRFPDQMKFPLSTPVIWPRTGQTLQGHLVAYHGQIPSRNAMQAWFDAALFSPDLMVRTWRSGDLFYPFGLQGKRKKVQDFFTDIKLSRGQRSQVPLLVAPEGILWIGGYRADERFRVTSSTRNILAATISLKEKEE